MSSESRVRATAQGLSGRLAGRTTEDEEDFAIETCGLSKVYSVYARPRDRLKQLLRPWRRYYSEFIAVRNVDLYIRRGETMGIVGRNGSGKSTLLRMICGILEPSSGTLRVNGHLAPILTLGAGFNPEFTGRENVIINAAILGLSNGDIHDRMDAIMEFADIGPFFDMPVKSYSSGMYSRLAFSVAIHADPDILVIDEVLAVGDEAYTRKCFARIEEIKAAGSTILFVSHAANLVIELCDRALLLEEGERLLTADPKTVISRYQRLLYAPASRAPDIVAEIRALDRGEIRAPDMAEDPDLAASESLLLECEDWGRYDPYLRPKSTVEYECIGARIENPRILDPAGSHVNVLLAGRVYTYAYEVLFEKSASNVRFGMMIKSVSGFELAGQASHVALSGIQYVEAASRARVRFRFHTLLAPGTYFLNAGVLGVGQDGGEAYLHRILDAVMFRIDPEKILRTTGVVDLAGSFSPKIQIESRAMSGPNPA